MKKVITLIALIITPLLEAQNLKTENVFLITLDGLRWQELFNGADSSLLNDPTYVDEKAIRDFNKMFWSDDPLERRKKLLPFFWNQLSDQGQVYGNRDYGNQVNVTNRYWFSYPGYSEILCGFADDRRIKSNDKLANPNITVLEFINLQKEFKGKVAAFGSWDVFPYIINEARSGVYVNAGFEPARGSELTQKEKTLNQLQSQVPSPWGTVRFDAFTHHFALEYIKKNHPRVVYIAYGETDDYAHDGDYDAYLTSTLRTDQFLQELWEYAQSEPLYQGKTTFIITTDHGRGTLPKKTWKHHGIKIEGSDQIWIAVFGPDTENLGEVKKQGQRYQNQVAKTVAAFLGLEYQTVKPVGELLKEVIHY